jgi:ATP-dependent Clp protease protease subunit|tara:strand:+ start:777 stop:1373 length:597 start_codon:yes stop_codon:yes gene_type:complete
MEQTKLKLQNESLLYQRGKFELDYGVDAKNNIIYLSDSLDVNTVWFVVTRINFLKNVNPDKPINLLITSYGGDVYSMLGIIDYIQNCKVEVNTHCYGAAMSAAAIILACGTGKRRISKNSTVMIHEGSIFEEGKISDILKSSDHLKELHETINKILSEASAKSREYWAENTKTDFYLNAKQCLEFGLVDEIIEPDWIR